MAAPMSDEKRRAGGAIRVPFVRRCEIDFTSGQSDSAFVVNINVLGAYVALDVMPPLGRTLVFRFHVPGSEREVVADGVVAWTNPHQEHAVHSLPPGFGVAFRALSEDTRNRIEEDRLRLPHAPVRRLDVSRRPFRSNATSVPGRRAAPSIPNRRCPGGCVLWLTDSRFPLRQGSLIPGGLTRAQSLP